MDPKASPAKELDSPNPAGWLIIVSVPTVFRQAGYRIMIYGDDHPPMHVHVFKAGGEVIINLGDEHTPPAVRKNTAVKRTDERRALEIVGDNQDRLIQEWRRKHG